MLALILSALTPVALFAPQDPPPASAPPASAPPAELMPVLDGAAWFVTSNPDLGELGKRGQQAVDHAVFRDDHGAWHLWSCVRGTAVGRVLYEWTSPSLTQPEWQPRGIAMRAEPRYGESIDDWRGQEWIQAPHVVRHAGKHWMFYGGHRTETGACQTCLATSPDGVAFERHLNELGQSRVFVGPGEARDPMVLRIGEQWHCYYTGHDPARRAPCKVYCRRSDDLVHWGEPVAVCWGGSPGNGNWSAECPFVVRRAGSFYLFRTTNYAGAQTWVYRSRDPLDFGLDSDAKLIGTIAVAAPEIVHDDGQDYISSVHDLGRGIQLNRLDWVPEQEAPTSLAFLAGSTVLWSFEAGTLGAWKPSGAAFAKQPFRSDSAFVRKQFVGHHGRYYLGTYEGGQGDEPQGTLRSPEFVLGEGVLSFLVAGGRDPDHLSVSLHRAADGEQLHAATGHRSNAMRRVAWDVRPHAGESAFLLVRDRASGSWGHINADDFRFHPRRPGR